MIRKTNEDPAVHVLSMDEARAAIPFASEPSGDVAVVDELRNEICALRRQLASRALREIVGQSPASEQLRRQVMCAGDDEPLLVHGAPGTNLDSVAEAVHHVGKRAHRPLVKIDCRLLSAERLEQELIHRPNSGAGFLSESNPPNRYAASAGGTLLLAEIDAIPMSLQRPLALFLREQRACAAVADPRISANRPQIILTSHANLQSLLQKKQLRSDLYDELTARQIEVPTLHERAEDIGLLAEHFIARVAAEEGMTPCRLTTDALKLMQKYRWPGNESELLRIIKRACSVVRGEFITPEVIVPWLCGDVAGVSGASDGLSLSEMERRLIETTFARCEGNRERTAQVLQIGLRTLSGKLREYGYPPRGGPGSNIRTSKLKAA